MIYRERQKNPYIHFIHGDCMEHIGSFIGMENAVIVTDPPFNIGYHYSGYSDKMDEKKYYQMLTFLVKNFKTVLVHYPEQLHRISVESGIVPDRVVSWVYNSNTAKQHRDIGFYGIAPDFRSVLQPYKNPNDKRIQKRINMGIWGGRCYDWWNVNQVKNVSKDKTKHPCQMPLEVMKNIVGMLPQNSLIIDPFMGSGTTALACIELGYDFVGIEIDKTYYDLSKERINANKEVTINE